MRIIVTGDQKFNDYKLLKRKLNLYTLKLATVEVVTANNTYRVYEKGKSYLVGADALAQKWACENYYQYQVSHEKKEGKQFAELVELAKVAVVFTKGKEYWSKAFVGFCRHMGVKLKVVKY